MLRIFFIKYQYPLSQILLIC